MGYFIVLFLLLIIASLGTAGFFMLRRPTEDGQKKSAQSRNMARALTFRIGLSVTLFLCILIAWQLGYIHPTGVPLR